ncbi:HAD family hydrolase [Intrasporangium sp.]|uniref:HAD family hydrolase n=1 Tax=Intrasporangium sp. TaxID=1925024 RepID=UPI00293AE60B|nr:HAD family hydrolase [Intrasporangium sp.]MDV3221239.1 Cof-type HAD-IIB family hydrolase [Intrasporangium sp.]
MDDTPRLIATDLDGTLLRSDGTLSRRAGAVLAAVEEAGIEVVFVTARPPRWLDELASAVGGHGTAICGNGAFVYDVAAGEVLSSEGFEHSLVRQIVTDLRRAVPDVAFAAERGSGLWFETSFPHDPTHHVPNDAVEAPIDELDDEAVGKLLAKSAVLEDEEFLRRATEVVGDRAHVAFSGAGGLAEINAAGVTKAAALERWSSRLGILAGDVWAFGDMPNDVPMIRWAGVGWAVANAHEEVRAVADRVCPSNDDDGVAATLEELLDRTR